MRNFFLICLCALAFLSSCTQSNTDFNTEEANEVLEIKTLLDKAAIEFRAPSLILTESEISLALTGSHPLEIQADRVECNDYPFKRRVQDLVEYQVDIFTIVGEILPAFGQEVETTNPRDVSQNGVIDINDLGTLLGYFGNEFEPVYFDEVELIGGEVSGSGEFANFSGSLIVAGDTLEILNLYKGSNCFVQDYDSSTSAFDQCNNETTLTFATPSGAVKYTSIN